jgi:O-antigen/teichoic acid export membrane protein
LSQEDFGIYTIAYSILLLIYSISISGVPTLLIREVSVAIDGARKDEIPMLMSNAIMWTLAVCLMLAFVAASYFYLAPSKKPVFELLVLGFPALIFLVLSSVHDSVLRGYGSAFLSQLGDLLARPLTYIVSISIVLFGVFGFSLNSTNAILAFDFACFVGVVISCACLSRYHVRYRIKGSKIHIKKWFAELTELGGIDIVHAISIYSTPIVVGVMLSAEEVSLYKVAFQVSLLLPTGLYVANSIYYPQICQLYQANDIERIQMLFDRCCNIGFFFAFGCSLLLLAGGDKFLIVFFGEKYLGAMPSLVFLVIGQLLNTFTGPTDLLMAATGQQRVLLKIRLFVLTVQLPLTAIAASIWGVSGAACVQALSLISWNVRTVYFLNSSLHIVPHVSLRGLFFAGSK